MGSGLDVLSSLSVTHPPHQAFNPPPSCNIQPRTTTRMETRVCSSLDTEHFQFSSLAPIHANTVHSTTCPSQHLSTLRLIHPDATPMDEPYKKIWVVAAPAFQHISTPQSTHPYVTEVVESPKLEFLKVLQPRTHPHTTNQPKSQSILMQPYW